MRFLLLFILIYSNINALTLDDVRKLYKEKQYLKVCSNKTWNMHNNKYKNNEEFLNMFAHACMETDMINRMFIPISKLIKTPQTRANAVYYTTVLYQKKLLYHALVDGVDISYISLPKTNFILSKIFDMYVSQTYQKEDNTYIFKDDKEIDLTYKLYTVKNQKNIIKMVIDVYKDGKMIETRKYW